MKKLTLLLCFFFLSYFCFSITPDEYRNLCSDEKIMLLLKEYGKDDNYTRKLKFAQWVDILMEKPVDNYDSILSIIEDYDLTQYQSGSVEFRIGEYILLREYYINNLLGISQKQRICEIYKLKLDEYLKKYKTVDRIFVSSYSIYELYKDGLDVKDFGAYSKKLYKDYVDQGWTDITLNYY